MIATDASVGYFGVMANDLIFHLNIPLLIEQSLQGTTGPFTNLNTTFVYT